MCHPQMMLVLLAVGALLAVGVLGLDKTILDPGPVEPDFPFWAIYPGRICFAVGTCFTFQMLLKDLPITCIICLVTGAVTQGFTRLLGEGFGTFIGAIVMTLCSCFAQSKPGHAPMFVYIMAPFFTLTPGSVGLRTFESVVGDQPIEGYKDFWSLIELLIFIAVGFIVGIVIAKPLGWRFLSKEKSE